MAKNIDFMGATFPDVPSIRLPQHEGGLVSFDDTTDATATADKILQGYTAYANGQKLVGTASGGGGGIGTLLHTESLGLIQYSSTTAGSLGKSITVSGVNDYDMLIVEVSADTRQLNSHLCTVSEIILHSNASGYNDYKDFEKTPAVLVCTLNYVIYANGTIASTVRITASGLCGVYAKTANITSGVATLDFYARYDTFYANTINNEYTARVYGVNLYDLIP